MTTKEMIELVQQHHADMGEVEIIKLLNRAKDDFCAKTEIVKAKYTDVSSGEATTTADRRYYDLSNYILKIKAVWLNAVKIPRIIGNPIIDDDTSEDD